MYLSAWPEEPMPTSLLRTWTPTIWNPVDIGHQKRPGALTHNRQPLQEEQAGGIPVRSLECSECRSPKAASYKILQELLYPLNSGKSCI